MKISLTDREADVMQALWEHGPSTVAEVRERLADPLAYTTVLTVLRTLEAKGYIDHEEAGRGHRFFATIKQTAARKNAVQHLTDKLFKGSAELLFTQIVSDRKLSPEALERMRALLAEQAAEATAPRTPGKDKPSALEYGKSITDACLGWDHSMVALAELAEAVKARRAL